MKNTHLSTFEREMQNPEFKRLFNKEYKEFLLSELILALMDDDKKSVRKLAQEIGVSPTIVQNLRSGKQEDIKLKNFIRLLAAFGYHLVLEKNGKRIAIS